MFNKIIAFFKREDAYARAGIKRVEGLANAAIRRADDAAKHAKTALVDLERKLREEFDAEIARLEARLPRKRTASKAAPKKAAAKAKTGKK